MEVLVAPIEKRRREREELKREEREKQKKNFDGLYTRLVFANEKYVLEVEKRTPEPKIWVEAFLVLTRFCQAGS